MSPPFPRAAVSVAVRIHIKNITRYALIQRANEPNKGMWSLPGGKIKLGEGTMEAARRELEEETGLKVMTDKNKYLLRWYEGGPFTCSDSIHLYPQGSGGIETTDSVKYHYIIAQCFAEVDSTNLSVPPPLFASDDALDAKWLTLEEIQNGVKKGHLTNGVQDVYKRVEDIYAAGLFAPE